MLVCVTCAIVIYEMFLVCGAAICHQEEITDGFDALQYELEMIQKVEKQCLEHSQSSPSKNGTFCEQVFDGIMCWPQTPAGSISIQKCPSYMYAVLPNGNATRTCMKNGQWYVHTEFNTTWTNLSGCYDITKPYGTSILVPAIIQKHIRYIQILYQVGYSISLVSLLVAVTIMLILRNLHCQRNMIHTNLFISFICRSVICFIKDVYVIPEVYNVNENKDGLLFGQSHGCKIVYTLFYYILSTNFMWIFVEGVYMHTFVHDTKYNVSTNLYRTLLVFGWGAPSTFVIPWVIVRIKYENTLCWSTHDEDNKYYWIIKGPITVTVVINFLFFVNIIRVLYIKLTASYNGNPRRYRKLAKSTLILIPLFGVYYIIFIAVPVCMDPLLEVIWMYIELFFNSFQGFAVSVLFCFMNEEVKKEIRQCRRSTSHSIRRNSLISTRSRSRSITAYLFHSTRDVHHINETTITSTCVELTTMSHHVCISGHDSSTPEHDFQSSNGVQWHEDHSMVKWNL